MSQSILVGLVCSATGNGPYGGQIRLYWIRKLPDGTNITVSSLGGIKQV